MGWEGKAVFVLLCFSFLLRCFFGAVLESVWSDNLFFVFLFFFFSDFKKPSDSDTVFVLRRCLISDLSDDDLIGMPAFSRFPLTFGDIIIFPFFLLSLSLKILIKIPVVTISSFVFEWDGVASDGNTVWIRLGIKTWWRRKDLFWIKCLSLSGQFIRSFTFFLNVTTSDFHGVAIIRCLVWFQQLPLTVTDRRQCLGFGSIFGAHRSPTPTTSSSPILCQIGHS